MDEQIKDQSETYEVPAASDDNGASYTLEWLPPDKSPRLKCWQAIDFDAWRKLANDVLVADPGIGNPLLASISRLDLCWRRLRDDYLNWFIPQGPLGTHAHVHYSKPEDKMIQENVLAAMAVDYEAALMFLDTGLDLTARGFGILFGYAIPSWRTLVKEAETTSVWMSDRLKRVVRQLQRGAMYARNVGVVHPNANYVVIRWDNTGNITYLRLPVMPCDEAVMNELDAFWHRVAPVREDCHVGQPFLPAWQVVENIDLFYAAGLDENDRKLLFEFREKVGFTLPGAYVIAPAVNSYVSELIALHSGSSGESS